jgi:hypothetical protein
LVEIGCPLIIQLLLRLSHLRSLLSKWRQVELWHIGGTVLTEELGEIIENNYLNSLTSFT